MKVGKGKDVGKQVCGQQAKIQAKRTRTLIIGCREIFLFFLGTYSRYVLVYPNRSKHKHVKCRLIAGDLYLGALLLPRSTWTQLEVVYIFPVATPRFCK